MDIGDFIQKIEAEFEDIPKGTIKPSTILSHIEGWGSMHALIVVALADTEYDVSIKGEELKNSLSVQELFDLIQRKKAGQ